MRCLQCTERKAGRIGLFVANLSMSTVMWMTVLAADSRLLRFQNTAMAICSPKCLIYLGSH